MKQFYRNNFIKQYKYRISLLLVFQLMLFAVLILRNPEQLLNYLLLLMMLIGSGFYMLHIITKEYPGKADNGLSAIEDTMNLAEQTLPYFRQGLDSKSAMIIADTVRNISNIPAVGITDKKNVLAFIGEGCEHHPAGYPIRTQATLDAIKDGKIHIVSNKEEFNCKVKNCVCPLASAIIVPLLNRNGVIGCLKFYYLDKTKMTDEQVRLAIGVGKLLSMQVDLADFDRQSQLTVEAKLDALQAQINPHFLFNSLNTINMYINKEPQFARELIVKLSRLMRYLLNEKQRLIPLNKEIAYVQNYVVIENARFQDKITIKFNIDSDLEDIEIPVLSIQPLVHNSIIHGILPKEQHGEVSISVERHEKNIRISVSDTGIGIKEEELQDIFLPGIGKGCGIGISNVDERLKLLYGDSYGMKIISTYGKGTTVLFDIPEN